MKKAICQVFVFVFVFLFCSCVLVPLQEIMSLEEGFLMGYEDVQTVNDSARFGELFKAEINEKEQTVGGQKTTQSEVVFKLFGLIPVRRVQVRMLGDDEYYVGGVPIGLNVCCDGAIVVSGDCLCEGDIITKINNHEVNSLEGIEDFLTPDETEVEFLRKGKVMKSLLKTTCDESGKLKLGLWVKDDVAGVGTLTFVRQDGTFGALGHAILENGSVVPLSGGKVFECNLIGIEKGKKNDPGQLRCVFVGSGNSKGEISQNTKFGVSGTLSDKSAFVDENRTAQLGGRLSVKMGDAKIVSSVSGICEEYDIEIIKTNYQKSADDKSLVFRVTDPRLLEISGGIVQGMSGSPIMQDGKIVGAVTHVFLNDPTKGYGVYVDWML